MNNLLLNRMRELKKEEFYRFELFLHSPYFNKSEKSVLFFDLIKPYYPDFILPRSVQTKISRLFPSKIAGDVSLSRINDVLDNFELQQFYEQKKFVKNSLKYELELDKKNNVKYYTALQRAPTEKIQSSDDLYAMYCKEFASIAICENNWLSDKEKIIFHSEQAMYNMLNFFLSKYLMIYANKVTHSLNISPAPEETNETRLILRFVEDNLAQQSLSVQCLFYIIQMFKNITKDEKEFDLSFNALKNCTFNLIKEEISYEIKYALIQASSACIFKCYTNPKYFKNAFELIHFLVENDLYFSLSHQPQIQQRFILIIKVALGAGEIDWATQFIENSINLIDKKQQNNFNNYALGLIYFHQQNYNEAIKLMIKININTPQYVVDYKITLLKMHYELNELAAFNYQSQTFLKYLTKEKTLNKTHKQNILDSMEFIKQLFKYKKSKVKEDLAKKLKLKKIDYLISNYRDKWFIEKYNLIK
ncbi:MAG: hypothetical protein U0U67_08585 [Chitinophagales bacterium]